MANLNDIAGNRNQSKHGERFYTSVDMAIIKKDSAILNSQLRRGDIKVSVDHIYVCGCGGEGCFIHRPEKEPEGGNFQTLIQKFEKSEKFKEDHKHLSKRKIKKLNKKLRK